MFTGIISHQGDFRGYRKGRAELWIEAPGLGARLQRGDSLAVNGVCLSLVEARGGALSFNLSAETAASSNLGRLKPGDRLNLELPLTPAGLVSGHLVTGHVDGVGKVITVAERRPGKRMSVAFPADLRPFLVPKGSVAVNGVSLTVASLGTSFMDLELIPLTLEGTNLSSLRSGDAVNIECDIIGKYVYNMVLRGRPEV
jgi:riboflavin synthase